MIAFINRRLTVITFMLAVSSGIYSGVKLQQYYALQSAGLISDPEAVEVSVNTVQRGIRSSNKHISEHITKAAIQHDLERSALSCILYVESSYNLNAISSTNYYGIGQINNIAWPEFNEQLLLTDLAYSINAAAHVLSYYKQLKQDEEPISYYCRYNVGPGPLTGSSKALNRNKACMAYLDKFRTCHTSNPFIGL